MEAGKGGIGTEGRGKLKLHRLESPNPKFLHHRARGRSQDGIRGNSYVLVSLASFCMMSRIILQAAEQPSGVEWMLMAFSAAPAFSFRCTSILQKLGMGAGSGSPELPLSPKFVFAPGKARGGNSGLDIPQGCGGWELKSQKSQRDFKQWKRLRDEHRDGMSSTSYPKEILPWGINPSLGG